MSGISPENDAKNIVVCLLSIGMYLKEQERRYKKDAFKTANWDYENVDDYYTCPNGKR